MSKFNFGKMVKAVNTWEVPVIRYTVGIVEWTKAKLKNLERKTRKVVVMYRVLHPGANTNRLYTPSKDVVKRQLTREDLVNIETRVLCQYLK